MPLPQRWGPKAADIKCLSLLKLNFNSSQLTTERRKQSINYNYWQCKSRCCEQRGEASQVNVKLPKLIRYFPSMILLWLNHLWLNKPYPGGDRPSVHRYLGKTPLGRSQRITRRSHTVGYKMQLSPTGPSGAPGGSSFVHRLLPLSHSSIWSLTRSFTHPLIHKEREGAYLSMITGSDGVSFLFPQLFLSQHRLQNKRTDKCAWERAMLHKYK